MANMASAIAPIRNYSTGSKTNGGPNRNRISQWSTILFAELLSVFVPTHAIENDPLLLNW
jgi:hypothetical protein